MKQLTITLKQPHPGEPTIKEQKLIDSTRNCIKDTLAELTDVDKIKIVSSDKCYDLKIDAIVYCRIEDSVFGFSYVLIEACPDTKIDRFVFHGGFGPMLNQDDFLTQCVHIANQIYELLCQEALLPI